MDRTRRATPRPMAAMLCWICRRNLTRPSTLGAAVAMVTEGVDRDRDPGSGSGLDITVDLSVWSSDGFGVTISCAPGDEGDKTGSLSGLGCGTRSL